MLLYHYCSNNSFLSIARNRELWATELSLSNDHLEGKWLQTILKELLDSRDLVRPHMNRLLPLITGASDVFGVVGVCLSAEGDLLSQWRGYADDGAGVCIGFDAEYLRSLSPQDNKPFGIRLVEVIYQEEQQKKCFDNFIVEVERAVEAGALRDQHGTILSPVSDSEKQKIQRAFRALSFSFFAQTQYLYQFKNPAFREEREWRLISYVVNGRAGYGEDELSSLEFLSKTDRITPMRRFSIPDAHAIKQVVLGPKNITPVQIVEAMLRKYGHADVEVLRSKASYR